MKTPITMPTTSATWVPVHGGGGSQALPCRCSGPHRSSCDWSKPSKAASGEVATSHTQWHRALEDPR